jgi:hypothetical protein
MAFLKVQRVRNKSGMQGISVSIVRSRRNPVTGRKQTDFVGHVGTYPRGMTRMYGGLAIRSGVTRACDRAMLTATERAQVMSSMTRMLRRH